VTVLVLGSANADLVVAVPRRPAAGETVLGGDTAVMPGGKGANTAVAAARLGGDVALVAAVGRDQYGDLLRDSLRESGVRTDHLRTSDRPTGLAYITVTPDGENSIVVAPGANQDLSRSDVDRIDWTGVRVLVCSLEVPVDTVTHAIGTAARHGVRPVLNLSPVTAIPPDALALLDPLIVNEHEASELAEDLPGLLALGPRTAVVTLGARGAAVVDAAGVHEVPAPKVEVEDTTGAGDAFAGALVAELARDVDLVNAARFACRVSATSVTRPGAQPSYPRPGEIAG
jgi:ribokinase